LTDYISVSQALNRVDLTVNCVLWCYLSKVSLHETLTTALNVNQPVISYMTLNCRDDRLPYLFACVIVQESFDHNNQTEGSAIKIRLFCYEPVTSYPLKI